MHISLDWISDYVDLAGLDIPAITNRLTLATAEVEGTKTIERFVKNVLVGEIKSAEKLTDKLTFCQVDCGSKTFSTVCGAPNVRIGLKAPFAPVGTILAGNVKVEVAELGGKPSQGILCSAAELGMSDWHEIILECPDNIPAGTPIEQYIPETDTLIEIDNKSLTHRPDLWGHYGFAREFAAIFGRELKPLPQIDLSAYDSLPAYPLKNEDYENCPCYGCIEFQTRGTIPSPLVIQRRLHALGMRSYNLLVDVTNYVNWEIAQPTHAFDADKLGGIRVATLETVTDFVTLDGQNRKLLPEDLLIWGIAFREPATVSPNSKNNNAGTQSPALEMQYRPVALAGVMGGLETEVSDTTVKLLLESANFKAARIRKTSTRLDLKTDASQRYEKSQPPSIVKTGVARILNLIQEAGAELKVLGKFTVDGNLQDEVRYIDIPPGRLELLSGITLPKEKVTQILQSLGFSVDEQKDGGIKVGVPPFRSQKDISIPEDIVEEVLRVYGYDNIPPVMPSVSVAPMFVEKHLKMEHKIKRILSAAHKFLEVHNYIWFNDHWLKTLDFEPGETLVLKNSTTPETSRLRTTLIPNLLALVPKNRPFREAFRLFEVARVFATREPGTVSPHCKKNNTATQSPALEKHHLAGIAFQRTGSFEDFYLSVKSAIEDVLQGCGVRDVVFKEENNSIPFEGEKNNVPTPPGGGKNNVPSPLGGRVRVGAIPLTTSAPTLALPPGGEGTNNNPPPQEEETNSPPWQTPGNFVTIYTGKTPLGTLGILDKAMTAKICREGGQIVWFEINLDDLAGTLYPEIKFEEPPRYPLSWQDFSLLWNVESGFDKLESVLDKFANPLVIRREFLVSYRGKGVEKGSACYSFRFWIGSPDHTLTGEEIETFHGEFLRYIKENSISLRV